MKKYNVGKYGDDRGLLLFASQKLLNFDYKYLTIGTMVPGSVRGGHYHERIFEKLMCISGKIIFDLDGKQIELESGDIVDIPQKGVHTLYNNSDELATFIEFKSEEWNKEEPDTYTPKE